MLKYCENYIVLLVKLKYKFAGGERMKGENKKGQRYFFVTSLIVISFVLISWSSVIALAQPDLIVSELAVTPSEPRPGEKVELTVKVYNQGNRDSDRFYVRVFVDDNSLDRKAVTFGLDSGERETVDFSWSAEAGRHEIEVVADDPFDRVSESNEDNNSLTKIIDVSQPATGDARNKLNVAVISFEDRSNSGFANVSGGVADMLTEKLVNNGFNVLERKRIEDVLYEKRLNPENDSDLARASRVVGADALITGSVTGIDVNRSKIDIGFLSVTGATVEVNFSYRVISSYTGRIIAANSISARAEGQTDASFNLGVLIDPTTRISRDVCTGGLRTSKSVYGTGEVISVGYLDNNPPSDYTVQFFDSTGSIGPSLFSNYKTSSSSNRCLVWNWNPPSTLPPGNYTVRLYSWPPVSVLATRNFRVSAGAAAPAWVGEITFGTKQFGGSVVGEAVDKGLSNISSDLAYNLNDSASRLLEERKNYTGDREGEREEEGEEKLKCRVVSLEENNNVVLAGVEGDCGSGEGVQEDEIFYLYAAESVQDPNTGELLEIIPKSEEPKGKVVVVNAYDKVSRGQIIGDFEVSVGDLAKRK
jgi:hypothetical protein